MPGNNDADGDAPNIKKIQYNVAGTEHSFEGQTNVDQEYTENINHDNWTARLVLDNGNWLEYRKLDNETMEECVFLQEQQPTGQSEAYLHDSTKIRHIEAGTLTDFWAGVDTHIEVYQQDITTVADAEAGWSTIVPAVQTSN